MLKLKEERNKIEIYLVMPHHSLILTVFYRKYSSPFYVFWKYANLDFDFLEIKLKHKWNFIKA